ncbi:MAG: hypothetical protein WC716_06920 [Chitinophagaceae bacterium]|jgi:hypothetical protein
MQTVNEKLMEFLKNNPNSSKATISEATGINGLVLFNAIKKLQKEELIISEGEGSEMEFSMTNESGQEKILEQEAEIEEHIEEVEKDIEEAVVKSNGRDNSKYKFNNQEYGKGPLVRAVVAKYVEDNSPVTFKKLKEVFPDTLLKRFGIFQDIEMAKEIGGKGNRYFTKPEQTIKLKDKSVVVCNQFTFANIQPFLKAVKSVGYKIK